IALAKVRQKARRRVPKNQARKSGCEEIHGQKLCRERTCRVARLALVLVALSQSRIESGGADAAAGDATDGEEIRAHAPLFVEAALLLEIARELLKNRRRPIGCADAAPSRCHDKHWHGPVAMRLAVSDLRLLVPGARRGGDGRPLIWRGRHCEASGRGRHDAIAAVTEAHPMEWMQPCIEHGEAD